MLSSHRTSQHNNATTSSIERRNYLVSESERPTYISSTPPTIGGHQYSSDHSASIESNLATLIDKIDKIDKRGKENANTLATISGRLNNLEQTSVTVNSNLTQVIRNLSRFMSKVEAYLDSEFAALLQKLHVANLKTLEEHAAYLQKQIDKHTVKLEESIEESHQQLAARLINQGQQTTEILQNSTLSSNVLMEQIVSVSIELTNRLKTFQTAIEKLNVEEIQ